MLFVKAFATHTGNMKMTRKGTANASPAASGNMKMTRKKAKNA